MRVSVERNDINELTDSACDYHEMTVAKLCGLYGYPVSVKLLSGHSIHGNLYTVDPSAHSVVVVQHFRNGDKKVVIAFGANVTAVTVISEDDLPDGCLKYTEAFCKHLSALFGVSQSNIESSNELKLRKQRLVKWLEENTIDVVEEADGTLVVFGSVRIQEPFNSKSCYCNVPLILSRICRLIDAMPPQ